MIEIDKNVPLPLTGRGSGRLPKYPWREMEVGDSFLFPKHRALADVSSHACAAAQRLGDRKFACRNTPEGVRVWRTE